MNNSFTSFSGSDVAQALLFPMEQVFESYVATLIKRKLNSSQYTMKTQDRRYHLFNYPVNQFSLRPDIVVADKMNGLTTIMDTKWKLLSLNQKNYGISQADMYQMYAYYKKYAANQVILIYPIFDGVKSLESKICFRSEDGALIRVEFVDFDNMEVSINHILNNLNA